MMALSTTRLSTPQLRSAGSVHGLLQTPRIVLGVPTRPCSIARQATRLYAVDTATVASPVPEASESAASPAPVDPPVAEAPAAAAKPAPLPKPVAKPTSPGGRGQQIFVSGAEGQTAIRIVQELLGAGFKVVAGVSDLAAGKELAAFVKRYELVPSAQMASLSLQELDLRGADVEAAARKLPKRVPFVIVDGDTVGKGRNDGKSLQAALDAAKVLETSQVVLVSGGGGGGMFGGGGGGKQPSQSEKLVMASGLPYSIVRASGVDRAAPVTPGAVTVAPLGSASTSAVTRKQAAKVVSELLQQPPSRVGLMLEASAVAEGDVAPPLVEALLQAISTLTEEAAAARAAAPAALATIPSRGRQVAVSGSQRTAAAAPPAQEKAAAPARPAFSFFGSPKAAAAAKDEEEDEEEEMVVVKPAFSFFGGTKRVAVSKKEEEEEEEEEAPPKRGFSFFGGGGRPAAAPAKVEPPPAKAGFFGMGTRQVKAQAPPAGKSAPPARAAAKAPVRPVAKPAPKVVARPAPKPAAGSKPAKQELPFGVFAWGSSSSSDDEEEKPVRRGNVAVTKKR